MGHAVATVQVAAGYDESVHFGLFQKSGEGVDKHMVNFFQEVFQNPLLALEAGILLGIGIGGVLTIATFLAKGDDK